jgi:hypothetical protein
MKKQILSEELKRMKQLAGLINESDESNNFSEYSNDALTDMIINLSRYENNEEDIQTIKDELKRRKQEDVNEGEDYEKISREVEYGINPYADEELNVPEDETISSIGRLGKNYPDEVYGEYEGELESIPGAEIKDLLYSMLEISNSEEDFIRKMTYALTNENFKLSMETEQKLRDWYNKNM